MIAFVINACMVDRYLLLPLAFQLSIKNIILNQKHISCRTFHVCHDYGQHFEKMRVRAKESLFIPAWPSSSLLMAYIRSLIWLPLTEQVLDLDTTGLLLASLGNTNCCLSCQSCFLPILSKKARYSDKLIKICIHCLLLYCCSLRFSLINNGNSGCLR